MKPNQMNVILFVENLYMYKRYFDISSWYCVTKVAEYFSQNTKILV